MTDKVQWKTLPTKANRDMEQAGADAAREYLERTGSNNLWVIYEAMAAAAPKPPASTEPVAVLYANGVVLTKADCGDVFDICCKVETPLYTHADPGEVERLVAANTEYARRHLEQHGEVERLRAQLAERDALCWGLIGSSGKKRAQYLEKLQAALSASAEPVKRDNPEVVAQAEGVLTFMRSESSDCMCCDGRHVFCRYFDGIPAFNDWAMPAMQRGDLEGRRFRAVLQLLPEVKS